MLNEYETQPENFKASRKGMSDYFNADLFEVLDEAGLVPEVLLLRDKVQDAFIRRGKDEIVDVVKKWISDLESGEIDQTTGRLKEGDKFCSLGVLCDPYCDWTDDRKGGEGELYVGSYMPPVSLRVKVFDQECGGRLTELLVELNDAYKCTFQEIAKVLRFVYGMKGV